MTPFPTVQSNTFLAFMIQSEMQRNMISVISFNALGEHAKGLDVFSAGCETGHTLKSEHSGENVNSFCLHCMQAFITCRAFKTSFCHERLGS